MEDYDYVMMVDENGSPYLAHVDWGKARQSVRNAASSAKNAVKSAGNKSYKYYQKLKEGGKTLYFYSADELKAHYDNLRKKASGTVDQAKKTAANVRDNAQVAMTSARRKADDLRGKAAQTAAKARQTADNMRSEFARRADQVGAAANNAVASVKDKAGVDERERMDAAKKAADEAQARYDNAQDRLDEAHDLRADAKRNGGAGLSEAEELVRGAAREREAARKDNEAKQKAYRDAQSEYDATVLGKADRAGEAARGAIDSAQEGARKAIDASKSKFDRMKDDFAKKAGQAKEAVGNAADKAKDLAGEKYKKEAEEWAEKAENSSKRMDEIVKNGYDDNAYRKERDLYFNYQNHRRAAENAYDNSLIGRAKSTVDSIKDATGVGQRERMKAAEKEESDALKKLENADDYFEEMLDLRNDAQRNGGAGLSRAQQLLDQAFDEWSDASLDWLSKSRAASSARSSYSGTPLDKVERAVKSAKDAIESAKDATGRATDSAMEKALYTTEKAKRAINKAKESADSAIASVKDKAGVDERERRDAAKKAADEAQARYESAQDRLDEAHDLRADAKRNGGAGLSEAEELVRGAAREREAARKDNEAKQKAYRDAQSEYDATVLGKGDRAKEAAGEAVSGIREVWNKLSSGKTLTKKDREILNEYNRKNR